MTLTDDVRPEMAMEKLAARFPHVLVLSFAPSGRPAPAESYTARVRGSDVDVASSFVSHVRGSSPSSGELALLAEAFEAVRVGAPQ